MEVNDVLIQNDRKVVRCPVCFRSVYNNYDVSDWNGDRAMWYHCFCGSVFHAEPPIEKKKVYTSSHRTEYKEKKSMQDRWDMTVRIYAPMIEELTWGRKMLDVGYCVPYMGTRMAERGWITEGIDILPPEKTDPSLIQGDFESYDFGIKRYDFILMGDMVQCFDNPVGAIQKAYSLLAPGGLLLVWTPDSQQMFLFGNHNWGHWNRKEHRVYFSGDKFKEVAGRIGFDLVVFWRNVNSRFVSTNTFHCLLQKPMVRLEHEEYKENTDGKNDKPTVG